MHTGNLCARFPFWWLALCPLLLAALVASMHLDAFAFNRDEPDTVYSAGIYDSGPATLNEVWEFIDKDHPTLAQGWTALLFVWGRLVGWSEPAIRSLPYLAGLLTLALLYRAGHDLLTPRAGLYATMLASGSLFFLSYMLIASIYTLVAL
ncbi:MAG: glycosyltransferase family 39 protein, partial [Anaerolineaceae bacterium]|nr:glycosyltransferase family 39 protein [Anaerolineaceae bacterium]